jgi:hypothetical protein
MLSDIAINIIASIIFISGGFVLGKYRERVSHRGKNLEDYPFYPFVLDELQILGFDMDRFNGGVAHFLKHPDPVASAQLLLIGQQHNVENLLKGKEKAAYVKLFSREHGKEILDDTRAYLENYKRIVDQLGDSFPDTGFEILLHNLSNPGKALYHIKNNVTGRNVDAPATNLVLDLKMRRLANQSKLNYELNIGSRKFKCTTVPIYRENYGLVGALCINIDVNYINDVVRKDPHMQDAFLKAICKTDMILEENILSKHEFGKAEQGKRHFRDFTV